MTEVAAAASDPQKRSGGTGDGKAPKSLGWEDINSTKFLLWVTFFDFALEGGLNYPLDLVKTRLQVQSPAYKSILPQYTGVMHAMRTILKQEGPRGLWKGFIVSSVGYVPTQLAYYGTYELGKQKLKQLKRALVDKYPNLKAHSSQLDVLVTFTAGGLAEVGAGCIWVPLDVVSQRLQIQGPSRKLQMYKGGFDAFRKIIQTEGIQGLYYGYGASMLSYVPASAVSWATYELVKQKLYKYHVDRVPAYLKSKLPFSRLSAAPPPASSSSSATPLPTPTTAAAEISTVPTQQKKVKPKESHLVNFIAGITAGILSSVVTNPLDVAKTRLQVDTFLQQHTLRSEPPIHHTLSQSEVNKGTKIVRRKYKGTLSALKLMVREEGIRSLGKGLMARILFYSPISGLAYSVYELSKMLSKNPPPPSPPAAPLSTLSPSSSVDHLDTNTSS
ncbi:Solute carrier family 25 member 44 [Balamuthia mandrillaris]